MIRFAVPIWVGVLVSVSLSQGSEAPSILHIGDSHTVGTYGETIDVLLRSIPGARVKTVGSCGISPNGFLDGLTTSCGLKVYGLDQLEVSSNNVKTPKIDDLLSEVRPTLVVIELGANQINTATSQPNVQREFVDRLVSKIVATGASCLWVGPPHGRNKPEPKYSNLVRLLQEGIDGRCAFLDSRPEKFPWLDYNVVSAAAGVAGDGAHYDALREHGRTAVRKWAGEVFRAVRGLE
ncbi:MAG: SGNH/GDSL hydrolase family protein [Bdellovibrionales bacterium]|nr:SGNH/GDSL hydrolase family protein [Bdellovibrionales bacterium]